MTHLHQESIQTPESYQDSCVNLPTWNLGDILNPKTGLGFPGSVTFGSFDPKGSGTFTSVEGTTYYIEDFCCVQKTEP